MFNQQGNRRHTTFVCAVSLYVAETHKASIKDQEPPLPIIPFGIVAHGFVGQPFSKQLWTLLHSVNTAKYIPIESTRPKLPNE